MTAALVDRALSIGADPRETADERFRRRLLVGVALIILPVAVVWGCLYWAIGEQGVALTPWAYATGSAISLAVFARTRKFAFLRTAQQVLILVAPALGTVMLGGLDESSSVILWSRFAPLAAVAFDRPGRAWPWFAAFVATIVLALVLPGEAGQPADIQPPLGQVLLEPPRAIHAHHGVQHPLPPVGQDSLCLLDVTPAFRWLRGAHGDGHADPASL